MAFQFLLTRKKVANLTFSDRTIRLLELSNGPKLEVVNYAEKSIDPGIIKNGKLIDAELFRASLQTCTEEWGIKKRPFRFHIPDPHIVLRKVDVPLDVKEDELQSHLFLEMGSTIHLPFDEAVFDAVSLGRDEQRQQVLLIAAPQEVVESYLSVFKELKLRPIAADIAPLSLYRLCYYFNLVEKEDHTMIINMDETHVTISIFHEHLPIFMRPVTLNTTDVSDVEGLFDDTFLLNDVYSEIEKVFNFYTYSLNQGTEKVNKIFLSGAHSQLSSLNSYLREMVDAEIVQLKTDINKESIPSAFSSVLGLALKEVVS